MCRKIKCVCVNFDFIEFGGMTQRKFWYGLWCRSTSFTNNIYKTTYALVFTAVKLNSQKVFLSHKFTLIDTFAPLIKLTASSMTLCLKRCQISIKNCFSLLTS